MITDQFVRDLQIKIGDLLDQYSDVVICDIETYDLAVESALLVIAKKQGVPVNPETPLH